MIRLGVNVDHVATVRQARMADEPDPVVAATLAMLGGADNITVHLREDRRHIQERDVRVINEICDHVNLELAAVEEITRIACDVKPRQATLVPERREELTTEGGLDVVTHRATVEPVIKRLQDAGIEVALFVDPDEKQLETSKELGVKAVEIQTARYSEATTPEEFAKELKALQKATGYAKEIRLRVHMGHGINYTNVKRIIAIPGVEELNIGHSIVSRAMFVGMERAVREMKEAMRQQ
ncbi:MAG: pyridoxine 5'-phosphate synthase [Gemmataceae bacterium]